MKIYSPFADTPPQTESIPMKPTMGMRLTGGDISSTMRDKTIMTLDAAVVGRSSSRTRERSETKEPSFN